MLKRYLIWALVLVVLGVGAYALDTGQTAPAFKIADQFGKVWDSSQLKDEVVVVVTANRDSGRAMDPWVSKLKAKYGSKITLLGLMDLHTIPGIVRGMAKSRIRKETKDPLMLDFNGKVASNYLVNSKNPTVVVIGKGSIVKAMSTSAFSDSAYNSIIAAADAALKNDK